MTVWKICPFNVMENFNARFIMTNVFVFLHSLCFQNPPFFSSWLRRNFPQRPRRVSCFLFSSVCLGLHETLEDFRQTLLSSPTRDSQRSAPDCLLSKCFYVRFVSMSCCFHRFVYISQRRRRFKGEIYNTLQYIVQACNVLFPQSINYKEFTYDIAVRGCDALIEPFEVSNNQ